jgi:3-(3-hydroxy-phenyl)propionate hydroxylase
MFDQPDLEVLLRRALDAEPLAELASGTELIDLAARSDGRVDVVLRDVATADERVTTVDVVLGCDGANSRVRELIGSTYEDLKFEERWLVIDVRSEQPLDTWQGVHQVCDPARAGTYMQVGPGRYRWEFRLKDGEDVDSVVGSGEFERLLSKWLGPIPYDSLEIMRRAEYTFRARIADRWRSGSVFLLGDAAHLTPPFVGQGLCAGLRDASNLTWKLAAVLRGHASEALLDTYEPERKPHARALIAKARTVGWAMTGGQGAAARVRRIALAVACRIPGTTHKVLDADAPRLVNGLTVRRDGRSDRVSGGLVPQPWLVVDGNRRRLDDVTGRGHVVLMVGPPDAGLVSAAATAGIPIVRVAEGPVAANARTLSTLALDDTGSLTRWFRSAGATAVLVRPDHVVQARSTNPGAGDLGGYLDEWVSQVGWTADTPISGREQPS